MKPFKISPAIRSKLADPNHGVAISEVLECFANMEGPAFQDTRAEHETDPCTQWFVAETDTRRKLKIVYIEYPEHFAIKSAYEANATWIRLYEAACEIHNG